MIRVGIVGTGYAAKKRAETFARDERSQVVAVTGYQESSRTEFAQKYDVIAVSTWQELIARNDLDLVVICNINRDHGAIAEAALQAGKHVVVEYPLALDPQKAAEIIDLAQTQGKLLHVEHIEILGALHQTIRDYLPKLGQITYARYHTFAPKRHPLPHWTYSYDDYGFPLVAALSRVNRLIDLFGTVEKVTGEANFIDADIPGYYEACLCSAQFKFASGTVAHLTYGKGSLTPTGDRRFTIFGEQGTLDFIGNQGTLTQGEHTETITLGGRDGVFQKDTTAVLDYLIDGKDLYIQPQQSLYALQIADRIRQSA